MADDTYKLVNLALQGGGSHGALTWGVLDRILEDERLEINAISGTSAGAMNAVVVADGLQRGGREAARQALQTFWREVSILGRMSPIQPGPWNLLTGDPSLDHAPSYIFFENLTQLIPPAKLNPFGFNPLHDLVSQQINFENVNKCKKVQLFINATNVRTGRSHIFRQPELSADAVMASACLPFMYEAVEINGEAYWDGGYSGNPALYPLLDNNGSHDLMVVQVNPIRREQLPHSAREILNRLNEVTFNNSLIKELRAIHLLQRLNRPEGVASENSPSMRLHLIHAELVVEKISASSKINSDWRFLSRLHDDGYAYADQWLGENFDAIGKSSTLDLNEFFEEAPLEATLMDTQAQDVKRVGAA